MSEISIEIVPRTEEHLRDSLQILRGYSDHFNIVNIPDLLRFPVRSWQGSKIVNEYFPRTIPHLRAIDFDLDAPFPIADFLRLNNIREILIVNGDKPSDPRFKTYPTTSVELCKKLKTELPKLTVYAGIDQYRSSNIEEELEYAAQKFDAGCDGFFTNPFFDFELFKQYAGRLTPYNVYFGISPVITQLSKNYWERVNKIPFPESFELSLQWNVEFAQKVISYCREHNFNTYIMPVKIDLNEYLSQLFHYYR